MVDPFLKVKDSSVWFDAESYMLSSKKDTAIRVGVVLKVEDDTDISEARYLVEVRDKNDKISMWCRTMTRLGGVYNYEDYVLRGYTPSPLAAISDSFAAKAGDFVAVVGLNGEMREGLILGGLRHSARKSKLKASDGPSYASEFNGVETLINKDGEYTLTFKGIPLNQFQLTAPSTGIPILAPQYNPTTTGSFMKFDKSGNWELNDKALALPQSIKIDKTGGKINIKSGTVELNFEKTSMKIEMKSSQLSIDSKLKIEQKTTQFAVEATASIKLKALKVAIGSDGVELFDQLIQLIDAIGTVTAISPVGPCTALQATPQWAQIMLIKAKLQAIKGSL